MTAMRVSTIEAATQVTGSSGSGLAIGFFIRHGEFVHRSESTCFGQIRTHDVVRDHQFERRLLGMEQSNVTVP